MPQILARCITRPAGIFLSLRDWYSSPRLQRATKPETPKAAAVGNSIWNTRDATRVAARMPSMVIHLIVMNTRSHILKAASSESRSSSLPSSARNLWLLVLVLIF